MALTDTDRRRTFLATAVTLVALPALWWANTSDDSAAPNLAVVGVDVGADASGPQTGAAASIPTVELGATEPVFLGGTSSRTGAGQQVIAVPAKPVVDGITAWATFRSAVPRGSCIVPGLPVGTQVTVANLANGRSATCITVPTPDGFDSVVLGTPLFAELADLTDAPISVEIRQ